MDYESIVHRAITRPESLKLAEARGFPSLAQPDERRRGFVDHLESRGHLDPEESKLLLDALAAIDSTARRVRKVRIADLSGAEKRAFERSAVTKLVAQVEAQKTKAIEARMGVLDRLQADYQKRQEAPSGGDVNRRLLELREAELDHAEVTEREAVARLQAMQETGYSPAAVRVLAAKGSKARRAAAALQKALPPWAANEEGRRALAEIEHLTSLGIGNVAFKVRGAEAYELANVGELITGFAPTINDVAPSGEGVA